jgi:COP9 signalosome complex subunit 1
LIAVRANRRQALQKNALDVARRYEKEGKERLRRVNLVTAGLETTGPKKHDTTEDWYDYGEGTSAVAG